MIAPTQSSHGVVLRFFPQSVDVVLGLLRPCAIPADVEFSADDLMSILLHVMASGVDKYTTAAIIADLDYIQKFHFVPMTQSVLGYVRRGMCSWALGWGLLSPCMLLVCLGVGVALCLRGDPPPPRKACSTSTSARPRPAIA